MNDIHYVFFFFLRYAAVIENNENRESMVNNAITYDLKNMKYVLTDEQYKKYLKVLNLTLINRNIKK